MGTLLFTCPVTGMSVQHWLDDDTDAQHDEYETVVCNACTSRSNSAISDSVNGIAQTR
jgi:hypothetical protein